MKSKGRKTHVIGIVGGMGPMAGLDLNRKIFDQTKANSDQEHVPVVLSSFSARIPDRTAYLTGKERINPAKAIFRVIELLAASGAGIAGIPCNTAHSPCIFSRINEMVEKQDLNIRVLHMIQETGKFIAAACPNVRRVGLLATLGTYCSRVYQEILAGYNLEVIIPEAMICREVNAAVYHSRYGIKATGLPVSNEAQRLLINAIHHLKTKGVQAIILGCTELPFAFERKHANKMLFIDPTLVLARALVREAAPERLKPLLNT
ncbi:MAG: hypothetical protein A2268_08605 [Candidatus Raymondbacteria bacterium RifOxyA12_full_50_37]|uniref:Aspartate racemase n=1 Tax=Candidatus Raymondbacteria bacterium RIFOXYD12_FULL_49_13 TaxID=1817890 RepID=A0A1F7FJB0_UNCRA|nr:MAG: hypothetical protein A2268_08605 [Candidatus Raymondbacteria bacterium RifOxyA12_full_50_37]OGJ92015.1 MAG: hypothetical protein A2248_15740 [Candidatus Raymondbacteria bacterium RIFOXYA2_FULL_49_16]OGJ99758.1 MAG: hypothetical protein A2350_06370 [Candidatus Raymondbacteria bacterium RifOxyB12_full_50_8]OGK06556.1 MAG: hypothetical protein A2519_15820 [Candidatus Raymondbacteria bacterium RIFOXYD12_FULL_49_13]OGK06565.1 MAG: hypothetical protein A2487_19780 [Candidatus Raymondbacteria 